MNSRWAIYLKERFPLIPNLLAAWGMVYSAARLALPAGASVPCGTFALALTGGMIFLAQIRFMDELKDFEKDKLAHPERPLPRGLFSPQEFERWIMIFQVLMGLTALVTGFLLNWTAALWFGVGTFYLYLMYKEFFVGKKLADFPLLYAITHQVITVPMLAFAFTAFVPESAQSLEFKFYSILLVSAFFAFEVARKLDPAAHPLLQTYLSRYGKTKTALLIAVTLTGVAWSSIQLGVGVFLLPLCALSLFSLSLIWFAPQKFKWAEGIMMLVLLMSLWCVPLKGFL